MQRVETSDTYEAYGVTFTESVEFWGIVCCGSEWAADDPPPELDELLAG